MSDYLSLSIKNINDLLKSKEILPIDLVNEFSEKIKNEKLDAFITLNIDSAKKQAKQLENKEVDSLLFGIPIVVSDNIVTKDILTTASSKMLDKFIPEYDATVIEKLKQQNAIIIAKTNLSEFDINTINKENNNVIDGNIVAVNSSYTPLALGSSISKEFNYIVKNNPIISMKPTYGAVSRHGLISLAPSFEQIMPISKNIIDNAILFETINGFDKFDSTTFKQAQFTVESVEQEIKHKKIAMPSYYLNNNSSEQDDLYIEKLSLHLKLNGFTIEYINMPNLDYVNSILNILASGEASSNLSRYDGIRYGYSEPGIDHIEIYKNTRTNGFGQNVKQTIVNGTYILSKDNVEHYNKAMHLRTKLIKQYEEILNNYDFVLSINPTEKLLNLSRLIGTPSMLIQDRDVNINIIGSWFNENLIYQLGKIINEFNLGGDIDV